MCSKFVETGTNATTSDDEKVPETVVSHKIVCDPSNNGLFLVNVSIVQYIKLTALKIY